MPIVMPIAILLLVPILVLIAMPILVPSRVPIAMPICSAYLRCPFAVPICGAHLRCQFGCQFGARLFSYKVTQTQLGNLLINTLILCSTTTSILQLTVSFFVFVVRFRSFRASACSARVPSFFKGIRPAPPFYWTYFLAN